MKFMIIIFVVAFAITYVVSSTDLINDNSIKNPTYEEMVQFIGCDQTDKNIYIPGNYVCHDFTEDVLENAKELKIRAGYVYINCDYDGHAIVCFETEDRGLYFLEPQYDILFSEKEMNKMKETGQYDIPNSLFTYTFTNYNIRYWNNKII